ncbi:nucleotidyltransferase family protein [Streptomyces yaizuensis]|uniref:Nucleotidyltransferase family protein n=1 Tax=Streptomyces yaizuensis TaxID=2989713 RepID=A0ABQ5P5V5_9ACTN|nr:nucleotidyltransferase family protein [Streptomyces sp. YSPA8]GLF97969.1 nucleotidyltransferase family protein [Streptomyces sp. YSPA8]
MTEPAPTRSPGTAAADPAPGVSGGGAGVVAGLLLAAGGGHRLGDHPKALLTHHGRPLVEHAVRALRDGGCDPVHVVLGAAADRVRAAADLTGCVVLENPAWTRGMGTSLRAGLASLSPTAAGAVLVTLVDQPGVGAAAVARLRSAYTSPSVLAAAGYGGRRGHPVLIGADRWAGVAAAARGDRGARAYLREHTGSLLLVECGDIADPRDIDTPADLGLLSP